jgi:hypothetical protein
LIISGWLLVDHAAQFGAQAFDLGELLLNAVKERGLRLDSFVDQEGGGLGAVAKDSGLDELFEFLLPRNHPLRTWRARWCD